MQISEVLLKVCRIGLPRQPVHARGGVALEHEERLPEQIDAEVVEERGELLLPPLLSCLPYAIFALPSLPFLVGSITGLLGNLAAHGRADVNQISMFVHDLFDVRRAQRRDTNSSGRSS
jgi:hypothetical protein